LNSSTVTLRKLEGLCCLSLRGALLFVIARSFAVCHCEELCDEAISDRMVVYEIVTPSPFRCLPRLRLRALAHRNDLVETWKEKKTLDMPWSTPN